MGSGKWRLANTKKPSGMLNQTDRFLGAPRDVAACSVAVPLQMDQKRAADAGGGLAGAGTRSYELWWDSAESRMDVVLTAESADLPAYRQAFLGMYPSASFAGMDSTTPAWFEPGDPAYQIFDVGTRHGHYATVFDGARAHQLMTQVANAVQVASKAWIQCVFRRHPFTGFLRRYVARLDAKNREICRGRYLSNSEIIMNPDKKPHEHPEMGYDLTNSYKGLHDHAVLKTQSAQVLMSIRGIIKSDHEVDLSFDEIESLPMESIHSGHEHLTKYRYKHKDFWSENARKVQVRIEGSRLRIPRIGLFGHRLLPDPDRVLGGVLGRYFDKGWLGRYHERRPLPFVIMNLGEMPLVVHLPDPVTTPNIETTRGVTLPTKPSAKTGAHLGYLGRMAGDGAGPGGGDDDWDGDGGDGGKAGRDDDG